MGLKYYGHLHLDVLVDLLFEYGAISKPQIEKILASYDLDRYERQSVMVKLRRNSGGPFDFAEW